MSRRPRLLIVKTGSTAPEISREHGDYDQWFIRALGHPERFSVVEIFHGEPLPTVAAYDGVIVTGSPLSVCEPTSWMESAGATLREWVEAKRAVLGVCFGHQLLAHAYGTPIVRNPNGREIGTVHVELTKRGQTDPLLERLGSSLTLQATHTDVPSAVPVGTHLLAGNTNTPVQAVEFGVRARGFQFHPEISPEIMRTMLHSRRAVLTSEGIDTDERERAVSPSPDGWELLRRFEERFAGA